MHPLWPDFTDIPFGQICSHQVSMNIALETFKIKPASFTGMTCTAFQRVGSNPERSSIRDVSQRVWDAESRQEQQLNFKCNTGNLTSSLVNFPVKVRMICCGKGKQAFYHNYVLKCQDDDFSK